jgi:hypothetical protein
MKGIASTGAPKTLLGGWMGGWMDGWVGGWVEGKAGLRIVYSNQKCLANYFWGFEKKITKQIFFNIEPKLTKSCSSNLVVLPIFRGIKIYISKLTVQ